MPKSSRASFSVTTRSKKENETKKGHDTESKQEVLFQLDSAGRGRRDVLKRIGNSETTDTKQKLARGHCSPYSRKNFVRRQKPAENLINSTQQKRGP